MSLNPTIAKMISNVAQYIAYETDETHEEVCWLLEKIYGNMNVNNAIQKMKEDYQNIL
jgi:hypothetical protein